MVNLLINIGIVISLCCECKCDEGIVMIVIVKVVEVKMYLFELLVCVEVGEDFIIVCGNDLVVCLVVMDEWW